jgi:hypothetical protein
MKMGQTHQQILGAALQEMIQKESAPVQDEDTMSDYLILGILVNPKIKAKIWARQYADLTTLGDNKEQSVAVTLNKSD